MKDVISYAADKSLLITWLIDNAHLFPKYIYVNQGETVLLMDKIPIRERNNHSVTLLRVTDEAFAAIHDSPVEILSYVTSGEGSAHTAIAEDSLLQAKVELAYDRTPFKTYDEHGDFIGWQTPPLNFGEIS